MLLMVFCSYHATVFYIYPTVLYQLNFHPGIWQIA